MLSLYCFIFAAILIPKFNTMKKIFTILLLFFFATSIFAQNISYNKGKILQKHYLQKIPYEKVKEIPVVSVTINGKMYKFFFDTGASLCVSDNLYKELNLQVVKQERGIDAEGKEELVRRILLPELQLQELTFINTPGLVFNEDVSFFECLGIDGIIGSNMLRNSIIHFDEQSQQIIITDNIKKISLKKVVHQKMELSSYQSRPYITMFIQKGEKREGHKVLFDSGQSAFYMMSIKGNKESSINTNIVEKQSEAEGSFGIGFFGFHPNQKHWLLNIPEFIVNKKTFYDVIITTTHTPYSRIGAKLFQYGKVTLDYKKKHFYFEPFDTISQSELSKQPWAVEFTMQNDKKVVGIIWDKALESQINLGDELLRVNEMDIQLMNFCELVRLEIPTEEDEMILELRDIKTEEVKEVKIWRVQLKN